MSYLLHTTGPLERWDHLAWHYYGDASAYTGIISANRDLFAGSFVPVPEFPAPGTVLRIPLLDTPTRPRPEDLPPWLR